MTRGRARFEPREMTIADLREEWSEAQFEGAVETLMGVLGWRWYHTRDSRRSPQGFPDLVAVRRGRMVCAELKTMKGRLEPDQRDWLEELTGVGLGSRGVVSVFVWRPCDWEEIEEVLR